MERGDPWDIWPERETGMWSGRQPLLPPPHPVAPSYARLGWVLDWPVDWLLEVGVASRAPARRYPQRRIPAPISRPANLRRKATRRVSPLSVWLLLAVIAAPILYFTGALDYLRAAAPRVGALTQFLGDGARQFAPGATATSQAGATHSPTALAAPALGSAPIDLATYFGPPASPADTRYLATVGHTAAVVTIGVGTDVDRRPRVFSILVAPASGALWDATTADAVCNTFLPSDAALTSSARTQTAAIHVYMSAALAAAFPPAYFVTDSYAPVPAGVFTRTDRIAAADPSGFESCTIALGQH